MKKIKVEVTNRQILEMVGSLNYLTSKETEAWFEIGRNTTVLKPHVDIINESKKSIFDKYALKDENGNIKSDGGKVDFGENGEKADKLWNDVQDEKVNIEVYQFSRTVLQGLKLNPTGIIPLLDIIITD